jgi:hypothetical protein
MNLLEIDGVLYLDESPIDVHISSKFNHYKSIDPEICDHTIAEIVSECFHGLDFDYIVGVVIDDPFGDYHECLSEGGGFDGRVYWGELH